MQKNHLTKFRIFYDKNSTKLGIKGACCAVLNPVRLFAPPWTVACQAPLSMGILQVRIQEWLAIPSSRGSSQPRD